MLLPFCLKQLLEQRFGEVNKTLTGKALEVIATAKRNSYANQQDAA